MELTDHDLAYYCFFICTEIPDIGRDLGVLAETDLAFYTRKDLLDLRGRIVEEVSRRLKEDDPEILALARRIGSPLELDA
ncbi:MAG: hypothetical protein AAF682_18785 [Planctomycetota bacterium]